MALIPREVFLVYQEIVVGIQLPKSAVKDIEMLVRKVLAHNVDIVLIAHLKKGIHQVGKLEVAPRYLVVIIRVNYEKYPHHDCVGVPVLELGCCLQEFQSWM